MSEHHHHHGAHNHGDEDHGGHAHGDRSHGSRAPVVHAPPPDAAVAYTAAFDAAVPDEQHRVVEVDIEAREMD